MTANPPAQPRPPSISFNHPGLIKQRSFPSVLSRSNSIDLTGNFNPLMSTDIDQRPSKKRKIDNSPINLDSDDDNTTIKGSKTIKKRNFKYLPPSWNAVTSSAASKKKNLNNGNNDEEEQIVPSFPDFPREVEEEGQSSKIRVRTSCRTRASISVPNTPRTIECNSDAPTLEPKKPADYFPWTGKHPEDVINENNVKQGYYNRPPQPLERELNTAKTPLYGAIKTRAGMESLSILFSLLLDRKSKHGALSSISSFRPPPRVTLTETKRKSWIADLADANVPLRRLSRTIPQGIRGLALLEQCLIHSVPPGRALWFVKCVGANEIRTLKRKGVNPSITTVAENKWIRDWTVNIQQFWESAIAQNKSEKWDDNLRYTFELCARLYQDNLLDKDIFLDWLVKSFSNSKVEEMAIWLSLVQLHRLDLLRFRKRAKQFAFSLLLRYQEFLLTISPENLLRDKLRSSIRSLAAFRPGCFVMPDHWRRLRDIFKSAFSNARDSEASVVEKIEQRNELLLGRMADREQRTKEKEIVAALDEATVPYDVGGLSRKLADLGSNYSAVVQICLKWATSRFRAGSSRIYLVSRLLRRWQRQGHDLGNSLLAFFTSAQPAVKCCTDSYRRLFAELSRTENFSKSRFLQWASLKITHSYSTKTDHSTAEATSEHVSLLKDLHLGKIDGHMKHLKYCLLKKVGSYDNFAMAKVEKLKEQIQLLLHAEDSQDELPISTETLKSLDWSQRFELTCWIRTEADKMSELAAVELIGKPALPGARLFTLNQFLLVRYVVETIGDIPTLADILHVLSNTKQESILAALVDTVHQHACSLSAIGALGPLQRLYSQAYLSLRISKPSIIHFTVSLLDLCSHYPCQTTPVKALQHDLVKGDRARVLAACSPFSDGVAESLQQAGVTFFDDFEAILQAEANMHEQTMISLFTVLVGRITKSGNEVEGYNTFNLCQLLARLRFFRPSQADLLIKKWLNRIFGTAWSRAHQNIVLELLITRCLSIDTLLTLAEQAPPASQCKKAIRDLVRLCMLSEPNPGRYEQHYYVASIAAKRLISEDPLRAFEVLLANGTIEVGAVGESTQILHNMLSDRTLVEPLPPATKKGISNVIDQIIDAGQDRNRGLLELLVAEIDIVSLPFCRFRFSNLTSDTTVVVREEEIERASTAVFERLQLGLGTECLDAEQVQAVFSALPSEVQARIQKQVECQFFEVLPKFFQNKVITQSLNFTEEEKARSREAMEKIVQLGSGGSTTSITQLVEKLTMVAKVLGGKNDVAAIAANQAASVASPISPSPLSTTFPNADVKLRETVFGVLDYLQMFVQMTSMRVGSSPPPVSDGLAGSTKSTQNDQIKLISLLASIATQPSVLQLLQANTIEETQRDKLRDCMAFAIDVAATITDDLTEESRILCARILKDRMRDSRIQWLVGCMASYNNSKKADGQGLIMIHETKGNIGEFKPKPWELLESGGGREGDTCLGLGLFGVREA